MRKKKQIISLLLVIVMGVAMVLQTMSASAGGSGTISVGLNVGSSCSYGSYSTRYYTDTTNSNSYAYCVQPSKNSPASGTYTASVSSIPGLRAILYYGYGGPGFDDPTYGARKVFDFSDSEIEKQRIPYAYTHTLTALAYYNGNWDSMGSSIQQGMTNLKSAFLDVYDFYIRVDSTVPSGFTAYLFSTGGVTQMMATWRYVPTGKLTLTKVSANPALTDGNSCYSLEGAEFGVFADLACTNQIATLITDVAGNANTIELDDGMTVYVKELVAPKGFALNPEVKTVTITSEQTTTVTFTDLPQSDPVGVLLGKVDKETNNNKPQGSASLAGAEFTVKYYDGLYDVDPATQGKIPIRTWVLRTNENGFCGLEDTYKVSGDDFWYTSSGNTTIPVGTIVIQESKSPTGYLINNEVYVRQIVSNGTSEFVYTYNQPTIPEQTIRGGVKIAKMDSEKGKSEAQGAATLKGAEIDIISLNENTVVVGGVEYGKGQTVKTITTDKFGIAMTEADTLSYGDYKALEKLPPDGYLLEGRIEQNFSITENGVIVDLTGKDTAIQDDVIRGGVKIQKRDLETGEAKPQGGATLESAAFTITTLNQNTVIVDGKSYSNGQIVKTIESGKDGIAMTGTDTLPRGHYELVESKSPNGYLTDGAVKIEFDIVNDGEIVDLTSELNSIYNQVKRGDLEGIKVTDGTQKRLANVPFKITSKTTGESHTVVTDINGQFSTASSWVPHTQNTNAGTSSEDGVWFGTSQPDDSKGALIYDTYIVEEQRCTSNEGMKLIPAFEVVIARDNYTVDLGTLTDDFENKILIYTSAAEKGTGKKTIVEGKKDAIITDTVIMGGLEMGRQYMLKGWQMLKEDNAELLVGGKRVENELTFTATFPHMQKIMEYTFPAKGLAGKDLVTFEELYDITDPENPVKVAEHKDIEDKDQTVSIVERVINIHTSATEKDTGKKTIVAGKNAEIVDAVTLDGLEVGAEYQLKGWQMVREENAELLIDGKRVENELTFTAKDSHMEIPVEYAFNAKELGGKNLVTFEELYDITDPENPVKVAEHKDIEDKDQTVSIVERVINIHTSATEKETGKKSIVAGKNAEIVDTVTLDGLEIGAEYQLKGWQMVREENAELLIDGTRVENELTFTAKDSHMEIPVEYAFNAKELGGKDLVTFEELYDITDPENPVKMAEHKDIEDKDQTVTVEDNPVQPEVPRTVEKKPKTGDMSPLEALIVIAVGTGVALGILLYVKRKDKKK